MYGLENNMLEHLRCAWFTYLSSFFSSCCLRYASIQAKILDNVDLQCNSLSLWLGSMACTLLDERLVNCEACMPGLAVGNKCS